MNLTSMTSSVDVSIYLREEILISTPANSPLQQACFDFATRLTDRADHLRDNNIRIIDIFDDDLRTKDNAIRFYMKGEYTEASIFIRPNETMWLEINDLRYALSDNEEREPQELRLPGTSSSMHLEHLPTRRLKLTPSAIAVIVDLLVETKW